MIDALQTLKDNGLAASVLRDVLANLIDNDDIDDIDDHRRLVALEWYLSGGNDCDPNDCTIEYGDVVSISPGEYRVLTNDEADMACAESIEETLWAFNAGYLSDLTGIDVCVFEALANKCEGANDAVRSIINGSCGIDVLIEYSISSDGRGHFLSNYDGEENEGRNDWYIYRVN